MPIAGRSISVSVSADRVSLNTSVARRSSSSSPVPRFILRAIQSTKRTRHTDQHSYDLQSGPIERHAVCCAEWRWAIAPEQKSRRATTCR